MNEGQKLGTFHTACWVLGLIAFVELAAVGMALGIQRKVVTHTQPSEPQIIETIITDHKPLQPEKEIVVIEKPVYIQPKAVEIAALPDGPPVIDYEFDPMPDIRLGNPPIADPRVEKLVDDSRALRIAGDNARAFLKLEEAAKRAPQEPNVLYQYAEVYSSMGLYDKAADYYEAVFALGTVKAGNLYEIAAIKLRDGIERPEDMATKFALGRVRVYEDSTWQEGQRVILTIPVSAAPDLNLSEQELNRALLVDVLLYDVLDLSLIHI